MSDLLLIVIAIELALVCELLRRLLGVAKGTGFVAWHDKIADLANRVRPWTF